VAIELVHPKDLTARDGAAWQAILAAEPSFSSPLLTPGFAILVGEQRSNARVAIIRNKGNSIGFFPFLAQSNGSARAIGAPFSDYHGLIATKGAAIDLDEMMRAAGIRSWPYAGLIDPENRFAAANSGTQEAYQIVLGQGGAAEHLEMVRSRSAKRFKNWRRLEHKLERDHGAITVSAPDTDPEAFALLLKWKRDQLYRSGLQDILRPQWVRAMMASLLTQTDSAFGGLMITLRVAGKPVAAHFGARSGAVFHPWIAAFDPAFTEYSVGNTHFMHAIAAMDGLGLKHYDLATGSDHYKHCYASDVREIAYGAYQSAQKQSALDLWALASGKPGTSRAALIHRVRARLDHIAATENTISGQALGIFDAFAALSRRSLIAHKEKVA
jgi:CelD/BcsL family acetyltransferase involved in cellulose biosynthesis